MVGLGAAKNFCEFEANLVIQGTLGHVGLHRKTGYTVSNKQKSSTIFTVRVFVVVLGNVSLCSLDWPGT